MTDIPTFTFERRFEAPRDLVWRAWSEPELLARWYGPNLETITHEFDLVPGGLWLVEMRHGGGSMHQRIEYLEIKRPERMAWIHVTADAEWAPASSPMMPDWPRKLHTVVTFAEQEGGSSLRLTWEPFEASEAELACFASAAPNMGSGWESGMRLLDALLAELPGQAKA